jgi:hypothetical protein
MQGRTRSAERKKRLHPKGTVESDLHALTGTNGREGYQRIWESLSTLTCFVEDVGINGY